MDKICAYVESDNIPSRRVAEKAGLQVMSTFPGDRVEELWLEIHRDKFDAGYDKNNIMILTPDQN